MLNKLCDYAKNAYSNSLNTLYSKKNHFITGAFCVGSTLVVTSLASYVGCESANEWYTVGTAGAVGSFVGAKYTQEKESK